MSDPLSLQAYSALIDDLTDRGLMERTLVVAWGEFGRTPRVNNDAGRDHYPNVFIFPNHPHWRLAVGNEYFFKASVRILVIADHRR
jgi:hypothetical protein